MVVAITKKSGFNSSHYWYKGLSIRGKLSWDEILSIVNQGEKGGELDRRGRVLALFFEFSLKGPLLFFALCSMLG